MKNNEILETYSCSMQLLLKKARLSHIDRSQRPYRFLLGNSTISATIDSEISLHLPVCNFFTFTSPWSLWVQLTHPKKCPYRLRSTDALKRRDFWRTIKSYSTTFEKQHMAPQIPISTISENLERIKNCLESPRPIVITTG